MGDLHQEFERRKPWVTQYFIDGQQYGDGYLPLQGDPRVKTFFEQFPSLRFILELGSLEGAHAFDLARHPGVERVVGVEGRQSNCEKARFVQHVLGITNVQFVEANLENFDLGQLGVFDAVFCVGLLYHLPEPWKLISAVAKVSPRVFLWTHYVAESWLNIHVKGYRGKWYGEHGLADPLSGLSRRSFWPTLKSLRTMLVQSGFAQVTILNENPSHPHGPEVLIAAEARG